MSYKELKEQFITGHAGGSFVEITAVTAVGIV